MGAGQQAGLKQAHLGYNGPHSFAGNGPIFGLRRGRARDRKRDRAQQKGLMQSWISPKDRILDNVGDRISFRTGGVSRRPVPISAGCDQCACCGFGNRLPGSIFTPGPMVEDTATRLMK